jgi:hypothetical protein
MRIFLYTLVALTTLAAYELFVAFLQRHARYADSHVEAKAMRVRVLNQQGQLPGEIHY